MIKLDLSGCNLGGALPASLEFAKSLKVLNVSNNGLISSLPPGLGNVVALREIDLSRNKIEG